MRKRVKATSRKRLAQSISKSAKSISKKTAGRSSDVPPAAKAPGCGICTPRLLKWLLTPEAMPPAIPVEVASCLCRVAQEALHNVLKHAGTGNVRLNQTKGEWRLPWHSSSIYDRGVGFDSADSLTPLWPGNRKHKRASVFGPRRILDPSARTRNGGESVRRIAEGGVGLAIVLDPFNIGCNLTMFLALP